MSYAEAKQCFEDGDFLNAKKKVESALAAAKDAGAKDDIAQALTLQVDVLVALQSAKLAMDAAQDQLAFAQGKSDKSLEAGAWLAIASVHQLKEEETNNPSTPEDAISAAGKAQAIYEDKRDRKGEAVATVMIANAKIRLGEFAAGLNEATKSLTLGKELGDTKCIVKALEAIVDAYMYQEEPMKGLKVANQELFDMRTSGKKSGEAEVLEMISSAHAMLGESNGAMNALKSALELYQELQDMQGQGRVLTMMAENKSAMGAKREATQLAEQAVEVCKASGNKGGQNKALQTQSNLLVQRGFGEQAPIRPDAMKCLRALGRAVNARNVDDFKLLETKLNGYGDVLTTNDLSEFLGLLFEKDPGASEFLKDQGWEILEGEAGEGEGAGDFKTRIRFFDHKYFYLATIFGGMGFGPQFRSTNPRRVTAKNGQDYAISVSQLQETEAWQMALHWRPGYMDSGIQNGGTMFKPWDQQ